MRMIIGTICIIMLLAGCQNESAVPSVPVQYKPYQGQPAPAPRRAAKTPEEEAAFKTIEKIQNEVRQLKERTAPQR